MSFLGVTFSGVDETADIERLKEIRSLYFTVEWGLWLAAERQGREVGFPDPSWMRKLTPELNLSAYLWGKHATDFLNGDDSELMTNYGDLWPLFRRVQIDAAGGTETVDLPRLVQLIQRHKDKQMILRVRGRNLEVADALASQGVPCSTLFDQSDVEETAQKKWPKGIKRFTGCGYAGLLGPDNIYKQLSPILNAAQSAERWWVEVDFGLRTTEDGRDVFSLASCKRTIREFDSFFLDYTI